MAIMDDPVVLMDDPGALMGNTTQPEIPTVKVEIAR